MKAHRYQQLKELRNAHIKDPEYWLDKMSVLRTETLRRYGLKTTVRAGDRYSGRQNSPVGSTSLPAGGGHRKPCSIRVVRGKENAGDTLYAVFHDAIHLVLWHNRKGVYGAREAACVVLEHALVKDMFGARAAAHYVRDVVYSVGIEHRHHLVVSGGSESLDVETWARPQRSAWWKKERALLVALGVLTAEGKPTYLRADWRMLHRQGGQAALKE